MVFDSPDRIDSNRLLPALVFPQNHCQVRQSLAFGKNEPSSLVGIEETAGEFILPWCFDAEVFQQLLSVQSWLWYTILSNTRVALYVCSYIVNTGRKHGIVPLDDIFFTFRATSDEYTAPF